MRFTSVWIVLVLAIVVVASGCGSKKSASSETDQRQARPTSTIDYHRQTMASSE